MHFLWSILRNSAARMGSVVIFILVARVLSPEQLGIFSALIALMAVLELVAENGTGDALIQSREEGDRLRAAMFYLNLAFGVLLAIVLVLAGDIIERVMKVGDISPYLPALGLVLVLNATTYVPVALLRRQLDYRRLAVRSLVATVLGGVVAVGLAYAGHGTWSLVAQTLLAAAINAGFVWSPPTFRLRETPDFAAAAPVVRFGAVLFLNRALLFVTSRAIELVVAANFGPAALAAYIIGTRIHFVAAQFLLASLLDVTFSRLSASVRSGAPVAPVFGNMLTMLLVVTVPTFMGIAAIAQTLCPLLFGRAGDNAWPYLIIVANAGAVQAISFFCSSTLGAFGRPKDDSRATLVQATLSAIVLAFAPLLGVLATVALNFAMAVITMPLFLGLTLRAGNLSAGEFLRRVTPIYAAGVMMQGSVLALQHMLVAQGFPALAVLALCILAGMVIYAGLLLVFSRQSLRIAWRELRHSGKAAQQEGDVHAP